MNNGVSLGAEAKISRLSIASFEPTAFDFALPDARVLCWKNSSAKTAPSVHVSQPVAQPADWCCNSGKRRANLFVPHEEEAVETEQGFH